MTYKNKQAEKIPYDKDASQTPKYIYDWLNSIYNFDYDLCASDEHHLADRYFTKERSFLDLPPKLFFKEVETAFCNPPYSAYDEILDWVIKAAQEAKLTTVMLIPELNGEKRIEKILKGAQELIHLSPRISFIHPVTKLPMGGNNRGSMVAIFNKWGGNNYAINSFEDLNYIKQRFEK